MVDARGDLGVHDILLQRGRIASIDPREVPSGADVRDLEGKTVVPGLIDAHVHIAHHPMERWVSPNDEERWLRNYLRAYLAFGVTTVLDPGINADDARATRRRAEEFGGPRLEVAGPLLGPSQGYPSAIYPGLSGVEGPHDVVDRLAAFDALDPVGVKFTMEDGPIGSVWPLFDRSTRDVIIAETAARGWPLYAHAMDPQMIRRALRWNPHALVHSPVRGGRAIANHIARANVWVVTTLDIGAGVSSLGDDDFWSDPAVRRAVPQRQWETARDPDTLTKSLDDAARVYLPGIPAHLAAEIRTAFARSLPRRADQAMSAVSRLRDAGVPLVVGSDTGGSPTLPWLVHGPSTILEMRLLVEAGLTPLEVLRAATLEPARMMSRDSEYGSIEVGKVADLVVLDGDPLADVTVFMNPVWVVRGGEGRTPTEWLQAEQSLPLNPPAGPPELAPGSPSR